jgi:hypothetical protein
MVLPDIMKKYMKSPKRKMLFEGYNDTIYKYSHSKFKRLFKIAPFRLVFKEFYKSGGFDSMLKTDATLKRNESIYKTRIEEIFQEYIAN